MRFLSPEWIQALDTAARDHPGLRAAARDTRLVLEQRVTETPDDDPAAPGTVVYHIRLTAEPVVAAGPADDATVRLTTDRATAAGIARGELSAQLAFIQGRLRLGGDVRALLAHQDALVAVDDVFAEVRGATEW